MKFSFVISKKDIADSVNAVTAKAAKSVEVKGFRKGQAPIDLAVKQLDQEKIQTKAIEEAVPKAYLEAVKKKKLKPIAYPNITFVKKTEDEGFEFEAEIAQEPTVELGKYLESLKKKAATKKFEEASKIWTPDSDKKDPKTPSKSLAEQQFDFIIETLLEIIDFEVPELLVNRETDFSLSKMYEQLDKIGLTVDSYLESVKKTKEDVRLEFKKHNEKVLKIDFILSQIAKEQKLTVSPEELNAAIASLGDERLIKQMTDPSRRLQVTATLLKQKVIKYLMDQVFPEESKVKKVNPS